jgi:bifunctional non-homologous end joining protein LigD
MSERRFGSRVVSLTRPDKILFPDDGIRKQDIIDYYEAIAEIMLPHIKDRPLML